MAELKNLFSTLLNLDVSAFGFPLKPWFLILLSITLLFLKVAFKGGDD